MNQLFECSIYVVELLFFSILSCFVNSMYLQRIMETQDKFDRGDYCRNWPFGAARKCRLPIATKCKATKQLLPAGTTVVRFRGHSFAIDTPEARRLLATKYAPHPDAFA